MTPVVILIQIPIVAVLVSKIHNSVKEHQEEESPARVSRCSFRFQEVVFAYYVELGDEATVSRASCV